MTIQSIRPLLIAATSLLAFTACDALDPNPTANITRPVGDFDTVGTSKYSGAELYRGLCASCHGIDGVAPDSNTGDIRGFSSEEDFHAALNGGPGGMPIYPGLDSIERGRLFVFVRDTLGR